MASPALWSSGTFARGGSPTPPLSARSRIYGGTASPSALAVFRFTAISTLSTPFLRRYRCSARDDAKTDGPSSGDRRRDRDGYAHETSAVFGSCIGSCIVCA